MCQQSVSTTIASSPRAAAVADPISAGRINPWPGNCRFTIREAQGTGAGDGGGGAAAGGTSICSANGSWGWQLSPSVLDFLSLSFICLSSLCTLCHVSFIFPIFSLFLPEFSFRFFLLVFVQFFPPLRVGSRRLDYPLILRWNRRVPTDNISTSIKNAK